MVPTKNLASQLLLTTLLALVIIAIITVTVVLITTRDIRQVANTEKYNQIYNSAETTLQQFVSEYSNDLLTQITTREPGVCVQSGQNLYTCTLNADTSLTDFGVTKSLVINDLNRLDNYEMKKDDPFEVKLNNYRDSIDFIWNKTAVAMEFTITYRDPNTNTNFVVDDVYDFSGQLDSYVGYNPYSGDPTRPHPMNFISLAPGVPQGLGTRINTANIQGISSAYYLVSLRITPRMKEQYGTVQLDMVPASSALPLQIREYKITAYQNDDPLSPEVKLLVNMPLNPQTGSIFDYALITPDNID